MQSKCSQIASKIPLKFSQISGKYQSQFNQISVKMQLYISQNTAKYQANMQSKCSQNAAKMQPKLLKNQFFHPHSISLFNFQPQRVKGCKILAVFQNDQHTQRIMNILEDFSQSFPLPVKNRSASFQQFCAYFRTKSF